MVRVKGHIRKLKGGKRVHVKAHTKKAAKSKPKRRRKKR
jgi:hypothetical protein